jgi:GT2 family glycosyltransferase
LRFRRFAVSSLLDRNKKRAARYKRAGHRSVQLLIDMPNSRISVCVLTHNRAREVVTTVERLLALPEAPHVIVADNGSSDDTIVRLAQRFPSVEIVSCAANLGAAGRNAAVARVTTDYVAFSDDDTWWDAGSLARAVQILDRHPRVAVLNARVLVDVTDELDATCRLMQASPLRADELPGPRLIGYMAGACVFRTSVFRAVGGYEPRLFMGGEEALVALDVLAAGHAIVYCDALTVHHHPSAMRDSGRRRRLLARNAAWVAWMRLSWREVADATWQAVATLQREHALREDGWALLAGIGWAWRRRRRVPAEVIEMRTRVANAERIGGQIVLTS